MKPVRRSLRRHLSPLGADTASMLDLPPVRMGLLTKLNLVMIGLIFATALTLVVVPVAYRALATRVAAEPARV